VKLLPEWGTAKTNGIAGWWGRTPRVVVRPREECVGSRGRGSTVKAAIPSAAEDGHEGAVAPLLGGKDSKPNTLMGRAVRLSSGLLV